MVARSNRYEEAAALLTDVVGILSTADPDIQTAARIFANACEIAGWRADADWAWRELDGYAEGDVLPTYRRVPATLEWQAPTGLSQFQAIDTVASLSVYGPPRRAEATTVGLAAPLDAIVLSRTVGTSFPTGETGTVRGAYGKSHAVQRARRVSPSALDMLISGVARAMLRKAIEARVNLLYGAVVEDIWTRLRRDLEPRLAGAELSSHVETIDQNIRADTPAGRQAAMYGCRSLVTAVADHLWRDDRDTCIPLKGDGPGGHLKVTADRTKNRLAAYLHQQIGGSAAEDYLQKEIDRLWESLAALFELSNKGHDAAVSQDDAELAVIGTYILLGELASRTDFEPVEHYE